MSKIGRFCLALGAALSFCGGVFAEGVAIGPALAVSPGISAGELLFAELNCAACHGGSAEEAARLNSRPSPMLGRTGMRLTPQYLRRFLADPQAVKPGSTHPDLLHSRTAEERSALLNDLMHFLLSEQAEPGQPVGAEEYLVRQGRALFHTVGCVACHAPQAAPDAVPGTTPEDPALEEFDRSLQPPASVPLGDLARKTTVDQLARFLQDPLKVRPSGRMPSLNLSGGEATAIAVYLLRDQAAGLKDPSKRALIAGLKYQYYEESFGSNPDFDSFTPKATGIVPNFDISARKRQEHFGFRFSGSIKIPRDGRYTFFVESDDGAMLYINGNLVVDNGGDHAPQERRGSVDLKAGEHSLVTTFYNNGAGFEFKVAWRPPGGQKQPIPSELLSHFGQPMVPVEQEEFVVDRNRIAQGLQRFQSLGCVSCHEVPSETPRSLTKMQNLPIANLRNGCLAERPPEQAPRFAMSQPQRDALRETLAKRAELSLPLSPAEQVRHTLARLNCLACHTRDAVGGPVDARLAYFRMTSDVDMGDEGRIPPHLTAVGGKLRPEWMGEVLTNKGRARPYMATRMPQFGTKQVGHLPALFDGVDAASQVLPEPETTLRDAKFGRRLVGQGGLSCIACHTFGNFKSLGIPALDMTLMAKRLKYDWFHRYLIDPASLRPGTRMPTFWPGGEAVNREILDGHTGAQINAIWAYLSNKPETDLPPGLVQGKKEIVAETEPVIYRNFIAGAGTRAIGVGYPEKVNLAFDANNMRLAMIWQGAFIDGARHSSGRGEGFEPPLGNNVVNLPDGPPLAVLPDSESAWPTTGGKEAGFKMGGYRLDEKRRPSFFYELKGVKVEEWYEPVMGEIDAYFKRIVRFSGDIPDNLWFRAAVGQIEEKNGKFVLNGKVTMSFPGAQARIRASGSQRELIVPVRTAGGVTQIVEEIIW